MIYGLLLYGLLIDFGYFETPFQIENFIVGVLILALAFFIYMMIGHMVPRRLAVKYTNQIAYFSVGLTFMITSIFKPLSIFLSFLSKVFTKLFFNMDFKEGVRNITEEEIRSLVESSGKEGFIDQQESEMIQNIFEFDDTNVEQIMTHRTEISAISLNMKKEEIISFVTNEKFTRFPVYDQDIDHIVGTLHVKDLLKFIENPNASFHLKKLLRKPYYIPDSKKIRALFYEMKKSKNHIAIVIDEFGGTAGIVTIEDLIEEIVGNIFDEYDDVKEDVVKIDDRTYEIDGLANIDDIEDIIEAKLPIDDYDTLSGFILGFLGRLPEEDEVIEFKFNDFHFRVLEIKDKVITKVLASKYKKEEVDENQTEQSDLT